MSDYNDNTIVSMKFLEHVREKSGMYNFQLHNIQGLWQQLKEVVDNSADEALDKNRAYPIDITFFVAKDKSTYQCVIQDRGRGIPVNKLADCYTKEFTSGKYRGEYGGTSSGTFGIGSKASAALSKVFIAFTKRDDGFGYLRVEKGVVKEHITLKKKIDRDQSTIGTTVLLQPDDTMFSKINEMFKDHVTGEDQTGFEMYLSKLEYYSLFKNNVVITVRVVDRLLKQNELSVDPVDLWKFLTNPDSFGGKIVFQSNRDETPRTFVQRKFGLHDPIWELGVLHKEPANSDDILTYDIDVFLDDKTVRGAGGFIGSVNATPIIHPDSSHIYVFQQVLKDQLIDNIDEEDDSDKRAFFENKYRIPLSGSIFAGWQGAEFIGQDKSRFENRQFEVCYRQSLRKAFKKLGEDDPTIWDRLWELIQENFGIEYGKYSKTAYKTGGDLKNLCYDLKRADSFFNCKLKNGGAVKTELFITEGDSAAGRVKTERDGSFQAVLKLSGKPKNAIRDDGNKLKENAIYSDLCRILGVNRSDTNLNNMRFDKILLMTDADADGYHIVALMIGMFYKINPLILEEGRVCVTNPPLYSLVHGNTVAYLRDIEAVDEACRVTYRTLFDIDVVVNGGKRFHINNDTAQFRDICRIVETIGSVVSEKADLLNIDPLVLEQLVHCVDYLSEKNVNCEAIKKVLTAQNVYWDKTNNVIVLIYETESQSIEYKIPLANLQQTIRESILPMYERFHWKDIDLFITSKYSDIFVEDPCTFMMLYGIFQKITDRKHGIIKPRRFKGLGEMSPKAIKYTCIDQNTRCFTVVKNIGDVDRIYKMLGVDTDERKKLIDSGLVEEV